MSIICIVRIHSVTNHVTMETRNLYRRHFNKFLFSCIYLWRKQNKKGTLNKRWETSVPLLFVFFAIEYRSMPKQSKFVLVVWCYSPTGRTREQIFINIAQKKEDIWDNWETNWNLGKCFAWVAVNIYIYIVKQIHSKIGYTANPGGERKETACGLQKLVNTFLENQQL